MKFISALKAERSISQLLTEPDSNTPAAQKALASLKNSGPGAIPIMIDALATAVADAGVPCGKNRVARIMRKAGIRSRVKRKFKATTNSNTACR